MEATEAPPPEAAPEGTEAAAGSSQDGAETPTIDETIGLPPKFVGCTLVEGCALAAWHPGVCSVWLCSRRERKKISTYEAAAAPPPRDLAKKAREQGLIGPLKLANQVKRGASTKAQTHGKNGKKQCAFQLTDVMATIKLWKKRKKIVPTTKIGLECMTGSATTLPFLCAR